MPREEVCLPMGGGGYALGAQLATGGMAELFLARRVGPLAIAHPVVIKRLRPDMESDPLMVQMFVWEAWISARLLHPNIVRFHDFICHDGRHHLVMEHVPGCDLAAAAGALVHAGRAFPIPEAVEISVGLLRALGHAHALRGDDGRLVGLVHRDVSPQNVLLSVEGEVKLTDFGVAKTARPPWPRDCAGLVKGKLGYLAPEQLRGQPIDARTDLYGVGVILFELLAGRRLFRGSDDAEKVRAALSGEVPALCPIRPGCPALLEEAVRRALARDPEDRFDSAAAMEEVLADVLVSLRAEAGARRPGLSSLVREVVAASSSASSPSSAPLPRAPRPAAVDRDQSTRRMPVRPVPRAEARACRRLTPWLLVGTLCFIAGAVTARAAEIWTP